MQEIPIFQKSWNKNLKKLAIVFPNLYYGGVYSLASLIIYNIVNQNKNWICERIFLDRGNLKNFDLVGFTFQYELDINNIKKLINKYKPKITFAGGPCVNTNHKLLSNIVDFQILGEVESILPKIVELYTEDKKEFLGRISRLEGVYIPNLTKEITYTRVNNLDNFSYPLIQPFPKEIDKRFVFGKTFILEVERGCPFNCKFCTIHATHKKVKYRSLEKLKEIIDKGININKRKKITIFSPSFTHPKKKEILQYIIEKGLKATVPSIKVEIADKETLKLIKLLGQKTLTIAPECNERLRYRIGKNVPDKIFFDFVEMADKFNFKTIKLYFMIGLPDQTQKDLDETIIFIKKIKELFKNEVYVSINPFVPKPNTELSQHKFNKQEIKKQINYLKPRLNKLEVKYKVSGLSTSFLEHNIINLYR